MHVRELVELAALVAVHAPTLVREAGPLPASAIEQYWVASKCRLERWLRLLYRLAANSAESSLAGALSWPRVRPDLEEMLAGELLTRIWTAIVAANDRQRGQQDSEPIARNIFAGNLDVRRRLLKLLADERAIQPVHAAALNRLRRRVERWNDMLLAHLRPFLANDEFAFEPARARDFAEDLDPGSALDQRALTCQLMQASLQASFTSCLAARSSNADLNRQIGAAILSCFPAGLLDSSSLAHWLWLDRLSRSTHDAQAMIDDLVRLEETRPLA